MSEPNLLQSQTEEIKQHIEKMDRRMDKSGWLVITFRIKFKIYKLT